MKRITYTLMMCSLLSLKANAQELRPLTLGLGAHAGKTFRDPFKAVAGGEVSLEKGIARDLDITLNTGFRHFFEKDYLKGFPRFGSPYNVVPVKAGLKYHIGTGLYVSADAGTGLGAEEWKSRFAWSSSLGYTFSNHLDLHFMFEDFGYGPMTRQLAFGLGYKFELVQSKAPAPGSRQGSRFGIYAAPGITTNAGSRFVMAAGFEVQQKISQNFTAFINAGFTRVKNTVDEPVLLPEIKGDGYEKYGMFIPVKVGLRYFPVQRFYVEGEAGIALDTQGGSSFAWSTGIGVLLPAGFDVAVKFDHAPNHAALRLAYRFGSDK